PGASAAFWRNSARTGSADIGFSGPPSWYGASASSTRPLRSRTRTPPGNAAGYDGYSFTSYRTLPASASTRGSPISSSEYVRTPTRPCTSIAAVEYWRLNFASYSDRGACFGAAGSSTSATAASPPATPTSPARAPRAPPRPPAVGPREPWM